ncbi:hypothetical protein [Pantoea sp. Lij88]|uniref:hypothetical protein n=1 Tax=Pantoea sp. Lij88 TaxID=3028622 RepID=UPI0024B9AC59|nr:hypothetical protein [Pantoea sp. Lij88]WHQ75051.1 hypothetical protein PU624_20050 [Pantoea sp. Lij88]
MSTNAVLSSFFTSLNIQEDKFTPLLKNDGLGIILRSAVNELDWMHHNHTSEYNKSFSHDEYFYVFKIGVTRLIKLALESRESFKIPSVMFLRNSETSSLTHNIVLGLGMIEHGRRVGQSVNAGIAKITQSGSNDFTITLPSNIIDEESYENTINNYYKEIYNNNLLEIYKTSFMQKLKLDVDKELFDSVYPFANHYIGYETSPLLDEFFFALSYNELVNYDGYDTFHYLTKFGGIEFQKYKLALAFIMSTFSRHEKSAEMLTTKHPEIKLENILTISSYTSEYTESMCEAINHFGSALKGYTHTTFDDAKKIFEVLSCSRKNTALLDRPGAELPLLIQSSEESFFRCITARHSSPFQFLLDSLRYHFSKDYDRHQQTREKVLQNAVRRLLTKNFNGLEFKQNIKIKINNRTLTDIDLVIIEESTGDTFLCQLKHQELYGSDLHAKYTRTARLKEQAKNWLNSINKWLADTTQPDVRATLRVSKKTPALTIYKVFITKHYAYPVKNLSYNNDTIYCNWAQLNYAIHSINNAKDVKENKINSIIEKIKELEVIYKNEEHLKEPNSTWVVEDLSFTIKHET